MSCSSPCSPTCDFGPSNSLVNIANDYIGDATVATLSTVNIADAPVRD